MRFPEIRKLVLLSASYFFYAYWDWRFALLLLFCSSNSYIFGRMLDSERSPQSRKQVIIISTVINLGVLGFFKYYGFFTHSFNSLLTSIGLPPTIPFLEVVLPVGISFFTFQAMSYVIDVYRGDLEPSKSFTDVLLYISFFPQLVAGPIVRAAHFLPQLKNSFDISQIQTAKAATHIIGGLFKKVVIANFLAEKIVDPVFTSPLQYSSIDVLFALYAYAVQIYCDFSAYSDIAIGIAYLFGYQFNENFDHPYRSLSVQEFWRRWHISLSTWLRDYLYIPLGGSRLGKLKTYRNLSITMLLGGLWHGAAWNFVFWGALHGGALAIERMFTEKFGTKEKGILGKIIAFILVFHFVCLTWIFFRASSFESATEFINALLKFDFTPGILNPFITLMIVFGIATNFTPKSWGVTVRYYFSQLHPIAQGAIAGLLISFIGAMGPEGVAPFIYFQF